MQSDDEALLCIHYYYPPIHSIGVVRNYHISKELIKHYKYHLLLTTSNRNILPKSEELDISSIQVSELATNDYRTKMQDKSVAHVAEEKKQNPIAQFGIKVLNSYPFNIWIGEGGKKYIKDGIAKGDEFLKEHPTAILYTSFRPYADLYIGYKLKLKHPNIKLVVDFRDLHVDPMYKNVIFESLQNQKNTEILQHADLVATVSNGLRNKLEEYGIYVKTIYNGCPISKSQNVVQGTKFKIVYTGSLFGTHRDPSDFFLFLNAMIECKKIDRDKLEICYAGKDSKKFRTYIKDASLEDIYNDLELISRSESLALQQSAHLNLLLTSVTSDYTGVLTGKLFEYIGSLSPTLVLIKGAKDKEIEDLMSKTSSGKVWYPSEMNTDVKEWLLQLYTFWIEGKEFKNSAENITEHLSWEAAGNKIISELNNGNV